MSRYTILLLANSQVRVITQTRDGTMWFGTWGGGVSRFDGQDWKTYTTEDGLATNYILWKGLLQTPVQFEGRLDRL